MSQNFKILINPFTQTNVSADTNSSLSVVNGYYVYNQSGLNKGIVTEFNVRQFLDDPNNFDVASGFFSYLTANTSYEELVEINESNKKLSDLFKRYYNTSVLAASPTPTSYIDQAVVNTYQGMMVDYYRYDLSQTQIIENSQSGTPVNLVPATNFVNQPKSELINYTNEESFYLPINLSFSVGEVSKLNFKEEFGKDDIVETSGEPIFLKQGFVLLNKETNPNSFWKDL